MVEYNPAHVVEPPTSRDPSLRETLESLVKGVTFGAAAGGVAGTLVGALTYGVLLMNHNQADHSAFIFKIICGFAGTGALAGGAIALDELVQRSTGEQPYRDLQVTQEQQHESQQPESQQPTADSVEYASQPSENPFDHIQILY